MRSPGGAAPLQLLRWMRRSLRQQRRLLGRRRSRRSLWGCLWEASSSQGRLCCSWAEGWFSLSLLSLSLIGAILSVSYSSIKRRFLGINHNNLNFDYINLNVKYGVIVLSTWLVLSPVQFSSYFSRKDLKLEFSSRLVKSCLG